MGNGGAGGFALPECPRKPLSNTLVVYALGAISARCQIFLFLIVIKVMLIRENADVFLDTGYLFIGIG